MNGPNSMYKMRPIIKLTEDIAVPKGMYKMNVIQNSHCVVKKEGFKSEKWASVILEQNPMPEVLALENRQEEILVQLAQLKQQLQSLREQLKQPSICATPMHSISGSQKGGIPEEIVVKVNPKWPPYSLLALNNLLQNGLNIHNYVHSALSCEYGVSKLFEKTCSTPIFKIILIWKEVPDTEFLISPTLHTVILTEVNLLRFLSRMGPSELNYEVSGDPVFATIADELLDTCYKLVKETTAKARQVHLRVFGSLLQKNSFLMGNSVSIVDVAGWSIIKQIGYLTQDLPASINKWIERCNQIFGIGELS